MMRHMNEQVFSVHTPVDFQPVIEYILNTGKHLVTLTGDLGAGKTTFTQRLAAYLDITETVVSPTFVVMKSYNIPSHPDYDQLIHIDAYRFEDESEAGPLRLTELFQQPRTLICLEWPERISSVLPVNRIDVTIEIIESEIRKVTVFQ